MKMKMTATSVSKESVPAAKFDIQTTTRKQLSRICKGHAKDDAAALILLFLSGLFCFSISFYIGMIPVLYRQK